MSSNISISYRLATLADREDLSELFTTFYYPNEPFNISWVNDDPVPEDVDWTLKLLEEGMSFVAFDDLKGIIVGACLTGVDDPTSKQTMLDVAAQTTNTKFAQYLKLYARLDEEADIYQRFNVGKVFHVSAAVVHDYYRGRAIATELFEKSFELAADLGFQVSSVNCSSYFTEVIAKRIKMTLLNELDMATIKDESGKRLVYSSPPHTHIRTYGKRLVKK